MENKIKSIVLVGGPCSGKSEGIEILRDHLTNSGYKVIVIPELASEIRQNGLIHTEGVISKVDFQRVIFELQLFKENLYKNIIKKCDDPSKIILLLDRGLLDAKIYLSKEDFENLISEFNLTEQEILERYDIVYHLESTAAIGDEYYNNLGNKYRLSTPEQAKYQDQKSIDIWGVHKNFHIINFEKSFEDKIKKLEKSIIKEIKK